MNIQRVCCKDVGIDQPLTSSAPSGSASRLHSALRASQRLFFLSTAADHTPTGGGERPSRALGLFVSAEVCDRQGRDSQVTRARNITLIPIPQNETKVG